MLSGALYAIYDQTRYRPIEFDYTAVAVLIDPCFVFLLCIFIIMHQVISIRHYSCKCHLSAGVIRLPWLVKRESGACDKERRYIKERVSSL